VQAAIGMAHPNTSAHERTAAVLLIAAAAAALILANSPLSEAYERFLHFKLGPLDIHHWVADGLMAVFFLLVGLEVKREWYVGRLASAEARRLPIVAALGGMAVPALVYLVVTGFQPQLSTGWAIPAATDIAFALGVLALLGNRAPSAIKLLLIAIAIIDDIGAVAIIAVFYTAELNWPAILAAGVILAGMFGLAALRVRRVWPYLLGFALLWVAVLQSGVHATIAGVLAAMAVPLAQGERRSPLKRLEHAIHPLVMYAVVPLFGFVSAGVRISGLDAVLSAVPLGVALGLFLGKQVGVFAAVWIADRTGFARKPAHLEWLHIYTTAVLCGIGFTMSLFIGELAFSDPSLVEAAKIGTLLGSALAVAAAATVLRLGAPLADDPDRDEADDVFAEDEDEDDQDLQQRPA
jgi:NhaA family Na+:H+ antiporter